MILSSLIAMISQNYLPAIKTVAASYSDKNTLNENRSNPSVRYRNYYYTQKTAGKVSAMFRCSTVNCYASISLKVESATQKIQ